MSYYPTNFYSSYPYGQYQQQPQMTIQQPSQFQTNNGLTLLQGKIVDGEDIVRVTDVPMGGYGIFPKADFSEIYIKSWNNNGTTSVISYRPVIKEEPQKQEDTIRILLTKMQQLEEKIDAALAPMQTLPQSIETKSMTAAEKRKEF